MPNSPFSTLGAKLSGAKLSFNPLNSYLVQSLVMIFDSSVGDGVGSRVSQKNQKSEFWNVTYPSGFHRLDEPPTRKNFI